MNQRELLFIIKARNAARGTIQQFRGSLKGMAQGARAATKAFKTMDKSVGDVGRTAKRAAKSMKELGKNPGIARATAGFRRMKDGIANTLKGTGIF